MDFDDDEVPELLDSTTETAPREPPSPAKVPLTIITGFLGAGKSTLLQYILTERHGYRIAVIMNEFGDTADIEGRKIDVSTGDDDNPSAGSEEFLELANGCLCCSVKDSGAAAIEKLMKKRGRFDYILLETTGLADPGPIASIFWSNQDLVEDILLDGVVSVVDGVFGLEQIQKDIASGEVKESLRQVGAADIVLINKSDIANSASLASLSSVIRALNPTAPVEQTIRGAIDLSKILNLNAYTSKPQIFDDTPAHAHVHDESCSHNHIDDISSILIPIPIGPDPVKIDKWIRTVLWEGHLPSPDEGHQVDILRCKGVWWTKTGSTYILQGVKSLYETTQQPTGEGETPKEGKIVLIGKNLSNAVVNSLRNALTG